MCICCGFCLIGWLLDFCLVVVSGFLVGLIGDYDLGKCCLMIDLREVSLSFYFVFTCFSYFACWFLF